jgi:cytochrome P450
MTTATATKRAPGPDGGFLGLKNAARLRENQIQFFTELLREHGEFVEFQLGPIRSFLINDMDALYQILIDQPEKFHKVKRTKDILGQFVGNGILLSDGAFWRRQRQLVQPAFHSQRVNNYARVMVERTMRLTSGWKDGETRLISEDMRTLALNIVAKTLFDADTTEVAQKVSVAMEVIQQVAKEKGTAAIAIPSWVPTPKHRYWRAAISELNAVVDRIIIERRNANVDKGDLLSMMLLASDEETGAKMTDQQAHDELMTLFLAGHDTTANALTWLFHIFTQYPEIEAKLVAELNSVLGGRPPELTDLHKLVYTEQIVKEVLRMYPPAWTFVREPAENVVIKGYHIPKGAVILISPFLIHRLPQYYSEPEKFMPERWVEGYERRIPKTAYIPFSIGPRVCIGNIFALMEARLVLATVIQRWQLRHVDAASVVLDPQITLRPQKEIQMTVHRRLN